MQNDYTPMKHPLTIPFTIEPATLLQGCYFLAHEQENSTNIKRPSMIVQLCGMSGAGKSTLAALVKNKLREAGIAAEILDGDEYRQSLCRDLGFSKEDRCENIRRLGFVASRLSAHGIVAIISAINPYNEIRTELAKEYQHVQTVYVDCALPALIKRDTKGLYRKAFLPADHPEKIFNLTGVNDAFDIPSNPDLHIRTTVKKKETCASEFFSFIIDRLTASTQSLFVAQPSGRIVAA
jgi:adenylylsulfate kinase